MREFGMKRFGKNFIRAAVCAAGIALLFGVTACKELFADIEEDFSYWVSEPVITGFRAASPVQMNAAGVQCVPSASPAVLTFTVRNPKNFSFIMPGMPGSPTDIISFGSGISASQGTDYTLVQSTRDTLTLTYTSAFLERYEYGNGNIGAAIKLYSTDGRKFNRIYKFDLEANTPPPDPAPVTASTAGKIALFKTHTADSQGKYYYVLCFKVDGLPGGSVLSGVPLHSDLTHVYVSKNGGTEKPYPVTLNSGGFNISQSGGNFIAKTDTDSLSNAEAGVFSGSPQPDSVPSGSWMLYLKTDIPVGGGAATYRIRLFDGKLYSAQATQTIGKRALPAPKVFAHADMDNTADSGVYTEKGATDASGNEDLNATNSAAHSGSETDPIPVYSAYGEAVKLSIKQNDGNDYPTGVILSQGVQLVSGSGLNGSIDVKPDFIKLPSPADGGGEAVYKVTVKATGEGFDDSTTRTLYYKVCREVKAVSSTLPMWHILRKAISKTSAGGTVVINGEIKATDAGGNNGEITIGKSLTIEKADGANAAVINANKNNLSNGNKDRLFKVESGKTLTLKNLTLKGGMRPTGGGAAGIFVDSGAAASLTDCRIIDCVNKSGEGGAVYTKGTLSLTRGSIGGTGPQEGNEARYGGGIYVASGSCTLTGTKILKNYADGGTSSSSEGKGGGIYVAQGGTCSLYDVDTMKDNTVKNGSPNKGAGAGIYVESGGICNIAGGTKIDEANDVYLAKHASDQSKNAKITVAAPLNTGTYTVAKITPEDYTAGVTAVNAASGVSLSGYADRFKITDQQNLSPPPPTTSWKLKYNGSALVLNQATTVIPSTAAWKTLKEAIEAPTVENGDEFVIKGTITATSTTGDHGAISVTKKITVKGAGSTPTLNASSLSRVFTVENGGELTLENLTLKNGRATGTGEQCSGGAIFVRGGTVNITNCTLTGNTAAGTTDSSGGAIYASGATVTITNCTLTSNKAKSNGGAVCAVKNGSTGAHITISGGTIGGTGTDANTVTDPYGFGGGIYINDDCSLTLNEYTDGGGVKYGVRIIGNKAGRAGGVRANNSTVIMTGCTFSDNSATDGTPLGGGGGVYTHKGTLSMTNCTLTHNTAIKGGGVILEGTNTTMSNCTLTRNEAENGGAIYVKKTDDGIASNVIIAGGTIGGTAGTDANKATGSNGSGGGIYVGEHCGLNLQDSTGTGAQGLRIIGNQAAKGKGVYAKNTIVAMKDRTQIDVNNDVYLDSGSEIRADSVLNPPGGTAACITVPDDKYNTGTQVLLAGTGVTLANEAGKFTVTPKIVGGTTQQWQVNNTGYLQPK